VQVSTAKGNLIKGNLPLGGFGMSRYFFDKLLLNKAESNGVKVLKDSVNSVIFNKGVFTIQTKDSKSFQSKITIGAFGKRSLLDFKMNRNFIKKKSPYLAVKIHVKGDFPENLIALHNFKGGYCGVSKVENNSINLCYITEYNLFKKHKNISDFQQQVVYKNKHLKKIFEESDSVFKKPLTISQISFETKKPVENHIIMCGDTAGMIHPLCGNGMGMAINSARLASIRIIQFLNGEIKTRESLEKQYFKKWNKQFKTRLKTGHLIARLFRNEIFSQIAYSIFKMIPFLLPKMIQFTHGKHIKPI
jgi:flavin-dependent dehydrogenase